MVQIPLKWFKCGFETFETLLNGSNLHSKLRSTFEWFEFAFECFESLSKGSKLDLKAYNCLNLESKALSPFRMIKICIRMLRIPFEWLEFAFECLESLWKDLILDLKGSNPFRMIRIWS